MASGLSLPIRRTLAGLLLLTLAGVLAARETSGGTDADAAFREINRIRSAAGVPVLVPDAAAGESARRHADELAERLSLSHVGADGSRVAERYRAAGGTALSAGENLGAGDSVGPIVAAWMNSPGHRTNLLHPKWRKLGIGVHVLDSGRLIVVAVFTDSRFELLGRDSGGTADASGTEAEITGRYLLSPGVMPLRITLYHGAVGYEPSSVRKEDGSLLLGFRFPVPGEWREGRPAAFTLRTLESGGEISSDLLILRP